MSRKEIIETVRKTIFSRTNPACLKRACAAVCPDYEKCCIIEKSDKQLEYIISPRKRNTFLKACPGSGKTEVVGLKAAYEFDLWTDKHCGIAILTFTNNAAGVIQKRIQQYAGIEKSGHPHFVGTIDSWLHGYLAHPFAHIVTGYQGNGNDKSVRIVDENVSEGWINSYKCSTNYSYFRGNNKAVVSSMPLFANMIRESIKGDGWEIKVPSSREYRADNDYFTSEAFAQFRSDKAWLTLDYMRKGFADTKQRFLAAGFATYYDIELACYKLLKERKNIVERISQRFPFIIIDECQDLSEIQLEILGLLKQQGTVLHFVGDLSQSIYEFKRVEPQQIRDFISRNNFETQELSDNFRSCQPIVDICQKLVAGGTIVGRDVLDKKNPACICFLYKDKDSLSKVANEFEKYLTTINIELEKSAIVARGWSSVHALRASGDAHGSQNQLAMAISFWSKAGSQFTDDAILALGHFIANKFFQDKHLNPRRYYCPDSIVSPLRWRLFLSRVLTECSKKEHGICDLNQAWDDWVKSVRKNFGDIVDMFVNVLDSDLTGAKSFHLDGKNFRVPSNSGGQQVSLSLKVIEQEPFIVKVSTIHSVKGETFDATLLVSSPDKKGSKGGHWSEWLANPNDEDARFAYVASSRPRKLLVWGVPAPKNKTDLKKLEDLGFNIVDFHLN